MTNRELESKKWLLQVVQEAAQSQKALSKSAAADARHEHAAAALEKLHHFVDILDPSHRLFHGMSLLNDDAHEMFRQVSRDRLARFGLEGKTEPSAFVEQLVALLDECARRYQFKDE